MNPPLVSVVIPAFNAAWCVRRAVDSVLAQDFRDFEWKEHNPDAIERIQPMMAELGYRTDD